MKNAEKTRERILEAAMAEFSTHGIAGARVDRIAKTARCNKNLIYVYFQDKQKLFSTVLQKNLARVYDENPFTPDDLPGYAATVFDFAMAHPELLRLMAWFTLEQRAENPTGRSEAWDAKIELLKKAQKAGRVGAVFPPAFLLTTIMTLATAWSAASLFGLAIDPESAKRPAVLRRTIVEAVRRLSI